MGVALLVLAGACGLVLTYLSSYPWRLELRIAASAPLGFATAALFAWLLSIPTGMTTLSVSLAAIPLALLLVACALSTRAVGRFTADWTEASLRWRTPSIAPLAILIAISAPFFIRFFMDVIKVDASGLSLGSLGTRYDWPFHLGLANYASSAAHLFPPASPWYAGSNLAYPFLPDFFSGALNQLGLGILASIPLVSAVLCVSLMVIFYEVARIITGRPWVGLLAALLFFCGGGLGFFTLFFDVVPTDSGVGGWLGGVIGRISADLVPTFTAYQTQGIWWFNPTLAQLIAQRNTQFGWPLGLLVIGLLWVGWSRKNERELLLAGVLLGLMPMFHLNFYVDILIFAAGVACLTISQWRGWLKFFVPALALGIPPALMLLPNVPNRVSFLAFQLGWMSSPESRGVLAIANHDAATFWLANLALLIPLAVLPFLFRSWAPPRVRTFLAPAWLLFVLPNVLRLSPLEWDNSKWLVFWAMMASVMGAITIYWLFRKGRVWVVLASLILVVQVTSGGLDLYRAAAEIQTYPMLSPDGLATAQWARDSTPHDSLFLTYWNDRSPILMMGGRPQLMTNLGTVQGTGIDYTQRLADEAVMFAGGLEATTLLQSYRVDYVVIGPDEISGANANVGFFASHYPVAYRSPSSEFSVYRVK